jgi:signal transduction histidine kinase
MDAPASSIARRLARALTGWTLVLGVAVGAAIWLAAAHEVDELLDDGLRTTGLLMTVGARSIPPGVSAPAEPDDSFAWQLVEGDGSVVARSPLAPAQAWHAESRPGFSNVSGFRVYGLSTGQDSRMLYVAQAAEGRREAQLEVWLSAVLATVALGGLGQAWLRARVDEELAPLRRLSARLQAWDGEVGRAEQRLGPAERVELAPMHDAVDALAGRLALRLDHERAFAAHAAHALRTPLAGIDAQLAVAAREAAPEARPRLERVRAGAARLQSVVDALLGLFRTGGELRRAPVVLADLGGSLSTPGLSVDVDPDAIVDADADLLAAALMNLVDNAHRHGASHARIDLAGLQCVRVVDDGPGMDPARRAGLQCALDDERYADGLGLGLTLADRVARAHGGRLRLVEAARGLTVHLELADEASETRSTSPDT